MDKKINILIIEDEIKVIEATKGYLEMEGYAVNFALLGSAGLSIIKKSMPDLLILDLMLPDITGEEICKEVRTTSDIPIIMLTAKATENDKINGLNIGADDYLIKPFSPRELVARVKAVLRRAGKDIESVVVEFAEGLKIDYERLIVYKHNEEVALTPNEYKILAFLSQNPGRYYSREMLIEKAIGGSDGYDRTVDSHIKNLRQKIEDTPKLPKIIVTQYGFGYKFDGILK